MLLDSAFKKMIDFAIRNKQYVELSPSKTGLEYFHELII